MVPTGAMAINKHSCTNVSNWGLIISNYTLPKADLMQYASIKLAKINKAATITKGGTSRKHRERDAALLAP